MLATAAPSLAASPPLAGTDVAAWDAVISPQGESGYYVPQRQEPSDANPQTGIVTMNNPDNALFED